MKMKSLATTASVVLSSLLLPRGGEAFAPFRSNAGGLAASSSSVGKGGTPPRRRFFAAATDGPAVETDGVLAAASSERTEERGGGAFDSFDYDSHWYPVSWARDVPLNQPVRVTVFDVDYALARVTTTASYSGGDGGEEEETFYAVVDRCPHKKVALSEGRITDCGDERYFQCSYHGWTFDGESGECVEIPQTMIAQTTNGNPPSKGGAKKKGGRRREDATAVAVRVEQGMVWLHPSRTPLEALAALEGGELLPPPRVPEMDMEGYRISEAVRDFPIDWTVLLENIMDPDHGYFAHSSSATAAKGFDFYSADGVENQVQVEEDFSVAGGWRVTSSVNAVEKLVAYNRDVRSAAEDAPKDEATEEASPSKLATTTFVAPSLVHMGRRDNSTAPSGFISAFWVCPTGAGRSRFMSATVGKIPFSIPRWLIHINLNNFLDQDTFLLCGQHRAVLQREAEGYLKGEDAGAEGGGGGTNDVRKSTYVYRSPSERMPVKIGQFFDATLARAPNRKEGVLAWYNRNSQNGKLMEPWPSREEVLDRYEQHTKACPDSMDVVRRCDGTMKGSKAVALALTFAKMAWRSRPAAGSAGTAALQNPFASGVSLAAVGRLLSLSASVARGGIERVAARLLRPAAFYPVLLLAFLSHYAASRVRREFFFKFDEGMHREDVGYIAKNWVDL